MTCQLKVAVYDKTCLTCMTRKLKMLRSPDKRLTVKLQKGLLEWMGPQMSERVKEAIRNET